MKTYTIKEGDYLYKISEEEYNQGNYWKAIAQLNKGTNKNPGPVTGIKFYEDSSQDFALIHSGDTLHIPDPLEAQRITSAIDNQLEAVGADAFTNAFMDFIC